MQRDKPTLALPYCPRPRFEEAAYSWLTRVGNIYGLSANQLIRQVISRTTTVCPERTFTEPYIDVLSKATRIARRTLRRLQGAPIDWILQDTEYCNVCIRCVDADILAGQRPFLRRSWRQAWKTNCAVHGTRLVRTNLAVIHEDDHDKATVEYHRIRVLSATFEAQLDTSFASNIRVVAVTRAIDRIEEAIDQAIDGKAPDKRIWGFICAEDFLCVVQDVTKWVLTNFESFRARPEAENLPNGVRRAADFYFTMRPRFLGPFTSERCMRSLSETPEPGLRAAALWMAEALLAKQESYCAVDTLAPPARQWRLLKRKSPAGLYWLHQQMLLWPRLYASQQWMNLEEILGLYR